MDRLNTIIKLIPKCNCVADIGSDHGKLANIILNNNIANKVIATDISIASLNKARLVNKNIGIEFRVGDGFSVIKENECQLAVIAGMGAETIIEIIENAEYDTLPNYLVLQPMNYINKLRRYICNNKWEIIDEEITYENKRFYNIIKIQKGNSFKLSDIEIELGPILIKNKTNIFYDYATKKRENIKKIMEKLENENTPKALKSLKSLEKYLLTYDEVLKE